MVNNVPNVDFYIVPMVEIFVGNGKEFLNKADEWKDNMIPCNDIDFFESFEVAQEKYEFLNRGKLEQKLQK